MDIFRVGEVWSLVEEKINGWIESFFFNLPNIAAAILALAVFYIAGRIIEVVVDRAAKRSQAPRSLRVLLGKIVKVVVVLSGFIVALGVLGLQKTVTTTLASAGVIGIVLGFALQDIVANLVSGAILIFRKPFKENDLVEIGDNFGTVAHIDLRATKIRTLQGQVVYVPNKEAFEENITNYSEMGERQIDIGCGVSYKGDLEKIANIAKEAVSGLNFIKSTRPIEVYYNEFGQSSINFTLRVWINFTNKQADFLKARSKIITAIKAKFNEEDISIPFPIRTIEFSNLDDKKRLS